MDPFWGDLVQLGSIAGVVWSAAWFLSRQANAIKELVYIKFSELKNDITDKLEYHERHDDERFEAILKDLWQIRVSNAARTGRVNGNGEH